MDRLRTWGLVFCLLAGLSLGMAPPAAASSANRFSFGVIPHPREAASAETALRLAIDDSDASNLAFVVAQGIKAAAEDCSDKLYTQRKRLLDSAQNGIVVSPSASDWAACKSADGKSAAVARLNRLREVFFSSDLSLGASRIPLIRQSETAKFRSYGENARWQIGNTMFATLHLPADNNHFLSAAGRNSEFEDRLIANRDWLQRVFRHASRKKLKGIVLFCDANPMLRLESEGRDGFLEVRRQLATLAARFPGKVLIVHDDADRAPETPASIQWRGNVGTLDASAPWTKVRVNPALPEFFTIDADTPASPTSPR